jgi:hypothetical protein
MSQYEVDMEYADRIKIATRVLNKDIVEAVGHGLKIEVSAHTQEIIGERYSTPIICVSVLRPLG